MHKKPLVAVFVLGLLLLSSISWAAPNGELWSRKGPKTTPTLNLQKTLLEPGTPIRIQAGTPLASPGTFCTGAWMGSRYYRFGGTFQGGEIYFTLQDPSLTIPYSWNPAGCSATPYKFNVTAIDMEVNKRPIGSGPNPFTFTLQPIVYDADMTTPGCPVPGGVKCAGPVYAVTLTGGASGTTFLVSLPFTIECCVSGPYFAAMYLTGTWTGDIAEILADNVCDTPTCVPPAGYIHPPPTTSCHEYIYADGPPWGLYDTYTEYLGPYNVREYSEGYTPNDPLTQCTAGNCGWQWWYPGARENADASGAYYLPNGTGSRQGVAVRFNSNGLDTLKEVDFKIVPIDGAPDLVLNVYKDDGVQLPTCGQTSQFPGTLVYTTTIPNASVVYDPLVNMVTMPDIVWGVLNGGLPKYLYVELRVAPGTGHVGVEFYDGAAGCGADPHTMGYYPAATPTYRYFGDIAGFNLDEELYMDAQICAEVVPIVESSCSPAGPDKWPTWAHDYRRTSASSMNLGDPCKVRAKWSTFLPRLSSFTNPVVAGGKVYVSSDNEVNSYDLVTGVAGNSVNAFPYMGGQVRSNVSVVGNRVFMTGGTGLSISCFDTTLTTPFWSNDLTGGGLSVGGNGPLFSRNRFGVTAFYTVGPDSIVVVGTESPATGAGGKLYALDAKTGFLYAGWATNPITLDRGSICSPAYDGTNLYVGTADFGTNHDGSLYAFAAATGVQLWNYKDALAPLEGWPGGVSTEGNFLYAATFYSDAALSASSGHRYAFNKATGVPVWRASEGPTLYAAPTIGRGFLYIPQDAPSSGLLMVNKALGNAVYNWSANGIGSIPCNVTLTCDKYLFAGDRGDGWYGHWWLLNVANQSYVWERDFTGIVNGTALARHPITGDDYAVVNGRSSFTGPAGAGVITAWRFNQPTRPFIHQYVYETDQILVPLNTGPGLGPYTQTGVYGNDGCVGLNITGTNLLDIAPSAANFTQTQRNYAAAYADRKIGSDYVTYFEGGKPSKAARLAGALTRVDGELTVFDKALENAHQAFSAKRTSGAKAAGAKADILRTGTVTYSANPILPGGKTNMTWNYDGTNLGRGVDDELIETVNDDPDYYPEDLGYVYGVNFPGNYPVLLVHYIGGCPEEDVLLDWNTLGAANEEKVYNHGALGDAKAGALVWGADANFNFNDFDGGFLLLGDSSTAIGGAMLRIDYYGFTKMYVPDPRPSDGQCAFDGAANVHMGYRRSGAGYGTAVDILGQYVTTYFSDTDMFYASTDPKATLGTSTKQVEIGAYDPMYGDFKLILWRVGNRDAVAKTNLKAGSYFDWDIANDAQANVALVSDNYNGYAVWDGTTPRYAFGMFDPNLPTKYCGIDPTFESPLKIMSNLNDTTYGHTPGVWGSGSNATHAVDLAYGWALSCKAPFRYVMGNGIQGAAGIRDDRGGFLINKPFDLAPNGSADVYQALYAVPATSNSVATIDALGVGVAKRAARWAGFARGDVNDDGCVNLADVVWLQQCVQAVPPAGIQIYPEAYCGDVNLDGLENTVDVMYLLNYVSGLGPAPLGKWRFTF